MITPRDYKDAMLVQDACNLSGVVISFTALLKKLRDFFENAKDPQLPVSELNRHPLAVMFVSKIHSLTSAGAKELRELEDLRHEDGKQLLFYSELLQTVIANLKLLLEAHHLSWDTEIVNRHEVCRVIARRMAELTHCESMQVFSLAYEACQHAEHFEIGGALASVVPASETWLHQVMSPSQKEIATAQTEGQDIPDVETLQGLLSLGGYVLHSKIVAAWTDVEKQEVEKYCAAVHLAASDNDVTIPALPEVLACRPSLLGSADPEWVCECGGFGVTRGLLFDRVENVFRCPMCHATTTIEPLTAALKAELKTPRMLAFAMGQLKEGEVP